MTTLVRLMFYLSGIFTIVMALVISADVILRFARNESIIWATPVSELVIFAATLLAAPWVLRAGGHVSITIVVDRVRPRLKRVLKFGTSLTASAVCAVIVWQGSVFAWRSFVSHAFIPGAVHIPKAPVLAVIPIAFLFLLFECMRQCLHELRDLKR